MTILQMGRHPSSVWISDPSFLVFVVRSVYFSHSEMSNCTDHKTLRHIAVAVNIPNVYFYHAF